jgi:hypothetical protein
MVGSSQSVYVTVSRISIILWSAECFPALNFVKVCLLKSKWCPKSKVKINVLNLSGKVKVLDLLKARISLADVGWCYGRNESSCGLLITITWGHQGSNEFKKPLKAFCHSIYCTQWVLHYFFCFKKKLYYINRLLCDFSCGFISFCWKD